MDSDNVLKSKFIHGCWISASVSHCGGHPALGPLVDLAILYGLPLYSVLYDQVIPRNYFNIM